MLFLICRQVDYLVRLSVSRNLTTGKLVTYDPVFPRAIDIIGWAVSLSEQPFLNTWAARGLVLDKSDLPNFMRTRCTLAISAR